MMPAFPANKQLMLRILIDLFARVVHLIDIRRSDIVGASAPEVVNARWASAPEISFRNRRRSPEPSTVTQECAGLTWDTLGFELAGLADFFPALFLPCLAHLLGSTGLLFFLGGHDFHPPFSGALHCSTHCAQIKPVLGSSTMVRHGSSLCFG
jgi:hypothetical protein